MNEFVHLVPHNITLFISNSYVHFGCVEDHLGPLLSHGYTGCNRRNVTNFGRVFLMLNYTEKPQNTYIQMLMVWEIMASEV
jgi:hypothetical protein